jgi:acyl-CoA thioesterase
MSERKLSLAELREFVHAIPFNRHVGIRLARTHPDGVTIECELRPEVMNASDILHGGVAATLADVAVGIAITHHLGRKRAATTVELKLNYLRPVVSGKIRARARLLRVGSTLACGRVDLTDDHKQLVGTALVTYMLLK